VQWLVDVANLISLLQQGNGRIIVMSAAEDKETKLGAVTMSCASCGKTGADDVKLKICTACKLVKYCSVECQKNHRPQHKKACKLV